MEEMLKKIKNIFANSKKPLIFFDDDPDGLASFLLFKKLKDSAKGVVIKSSPKLELTYLRKIEELKPDIVMVLDKPIITQEFVDKALVPIIWIDHHPPVERKNVLYFNPRLYNKRDSRPTTYWCYKITNSSLWIAIIGCVADWHVPEFIEEFKQNYPDLINKKEKVEEILFETKLGELVKMFSFLLKGRTSEVKKNISILSKIESPYEIIYQQTPRGKYLFKRAEKISKKYRSLLNFALKHAKITKKMLLFIYPSTRMSFTNDLANELLHRFSDKLIIVGREKENEIKISLRSNTLNIPKLLEKALRNVKGYGGGHLHACGSTVVKSDFNTFIENIKNEIKDY